jgi:hypothetical protein
MRLGCLVKLEGTDLNGGTNEPHVQDAMQDLLCKQ